MIDFSANVVRQHCLTKPDRESAGFYDASIWEGAKRAGPIAIKRVTNSGLDGTSVSRVLIGSATYAAVGSPRNPFELPQGRCWPR